MPRTFLHCISLTVLSLLFFRCANPVSPEGGPRDVIPPQVVNSFPDNHCINFDRKEIRITFDEFIQLKDQNNQVVISPPQKITPDFKVKGKTLITELEDTLLPNTTYSINFGDAILDITEGNAAKNFRFVFSTGSYIDSLTVKGKVISAFDASPQKDVLALLYGDTNDTIPVDSLPFHSQALYQAKTDETGSFDLENIRSGRLLLFALKDQNSNGIFDLPTEKVAFCDSLIIGYYLAPIHVDTAKPDTSLKTLTEQKDTLVKEAEHQSIYSLRLFEEIDSTQRVLRAYYVQQDQVAVIFRYPVSDPVFRPLNFTPDPGWMMEERSSANDSVFLWLKPGSLDSLILEISDRNRVIDTAKIPLKEHAKKTRKDKQGLEIVRRVLLSSKAGRDGKLNQFRSDPRVTFSYPIGRSDLSRILLVTEKDTVHPVSVFADSIQRILVIKHKWMEDKMYRIILPDSVFFSIHDLTNDSMFIIFRTELLRNLGSIKLTIRDSTAKPGRIIQLLNEKENILEQKFIEGDGKVSFDYLNPGKYKIKCIIDRNNNRRWDTGKYREKIQPEEVYYFPNLIEVRANWDVEEIWNPEKRNP
jgi:hypothetical protein